MFLPQTEESRFMLDVILLNILAQPVNFSLAFLVQLNLKN
jgi:hypothetical protein